jgi:cell filamentation protein
MADDDPYVYPGTSVLRNHFEIRDAAELAELEAAISAGRIAQLEREFISGDYDTAHLEAVHRKIFGDLYPWAGELRTVKIAKGESMFALPQHVA